MINVEGFKEVYYEVFNELTNQYEYFIGYKLCQDQDTVIALIYIPYRKHVCSYNVLSMCHRVYRDNKGLPQTIILKTKAQIPITDKDEIWAALNDNCVITLSDTNDRKLAKILEFVIRMYGPSWENIDPLTIRLR